MHRAFHGSCKVFRPHPLRPPLLGEGVKIFVFQCGGKAATLEYKKETPAPAAAGAGIREVRAFWQHNVDRLQL